MTAKRPGKRILKIMGISLGVLLVLLIGFHLWFKAHAKEIIEDLVESRSNGKLRLKIGKLHFNYFSRKFELEKAVFYNTDTATANTAYRFSVDKMKVQAKAILPIVFKKQLLIDSLHLFGPHIEVTRLRAADKPDSSKEVSIPEEMGKIYRSIQDALQVLQVKRFQIDNGDFTLVNKMEPLQVPVHITNLHFHIDNLRVDTTGPDQDDRLLFSDNIVLRSHDQSILFPDGRHRLSFSKFSINLKNQLVEFDSCTIAATRSDSTASSFNVFFDKLLLTSIDFDTLYRHEVIKADSVYCINSRFDLQVESSKRKDNDKQRPKLDDIIKQLTGDLLINHVVVQNADFNIRINRDGKPNTFTFTKNNFEMGGLGIDQDAAKPVKIATFRMAIRNYENFLKDSSYQMQFDSVHLINDKIILSNYSFYQLKNGKVTNSFEIPRFELTGLSWDDLIFDERLTARDAILYNPVIHYTSSNYGKAQPGKRQDLFQSLAGINNLMNLESFNVLDGKIDLTTSSGANLELEHATLFIESQSLLSSTKINEIKRSVSFLTFAKGFIRVKDITAELNDVNYDGNTESLNAKGVIFSGKNNTVAGYANDVALNQFIIDDSARSVHITGINWREADLKIQVPVSASRNEDKEEPYSIILEKINTHDTKLETVIGNHSLSAYLENFRADMFKTNSNDLPDIINLSVKARSVKSKDDHSSISIDALDMTDQSSSWIKAASYTSTKGKDSISFQAASLSFIPDLNQILNHSYDLKDLKVEKPVLYLRSEKKENGGAVPKGFSFDININTIQLSQPVVDVQLSSLNGTSTLQWNKTPDPFNQLQLKGLKLKRHSATDISLDQLAASVKGFHFTSADGKSFNTGKGTIRTQVKDMNVHEMDDKTWDWKAIVSKLEADDFTFDSLGKKKGTLFIQNGSLSELRLHSSTIKKMASLVQSNTSFNLQNFNGYYSDAQKKIHWHNAGFNRVSKEFSLDSISYQPVMSRDSFMAQQTTQKDYLEAKAGKVVAGPFDLDRYITDSIFSIGRVEINDAQMTDYKDKRLPRAAGAVKPLPVTMLKQLPLKISLDTLIIQRAHIEYSETNPKTNTTSVVPVTHLNAKVFPVRNFDLQPGDSLRIHASAYLLDTIGLRLRVVESYTDTLAGFLMTLRMGPTDMLILNPVLVPAASVKIKSGYIDTMHMRAVGREYISFGEMSMFYHDLKIQVLKSGNEKKKRFFLLNFIANAFIVKDKNTSRTGTIFYVRERDRSAINYLLRMAMSGMSSSVGVKNSRKLVRNYQHEIDMRHLPPIDLE